MRKRILSLCLAMLITASAALPVLADEPVQTDAPPVTLEEAATEEEAFSTDETVLPIAAESAQEEGENVPVTYAENSTPTAEEIQEILSGCSVELIKDGNFTVNDTSAGIKVKLHSSVPSCYLTVYAYASTTSFDPDSSGNIRLWSGRVTDGYENTVTFQNALKFGYKVIACLNVPVGEDFYRPVNSRPIDIVDESGETFKDYVYPDVTIDETELIEGATSLHISLTGDERLFEAAKNDQISITCAVGQYPADESFDFEGENQISLASNIKATEAFSGKEIQLAEPLKAGYRVRAVVYWTQNTSIFLPKGNDYEASFHRPDDSVLITPKAQTGTPAATIEPIKAGDTTFTINVTGSIPSGSILLVKKYDADTTVFTTTTGTPLGVVSSISAQSYAFTPTRPVSAGEKVVAFVMNAGEVLGQSEPVTITRAVPFTAKLSGLLTSDTTEAEFEITALAGVDNINIVALCKVNASGTADTSNPIVRAFGQKPGTVKLAVPANTLSVGDKVCLVLTYIDAGDVLTWQSNTFTVSAPVKEESITVHESSFTVDSTSATVTVKGYDSFKGGYIFITTGSASITDADSRTQIASVKFTGEGTYNIPFNSYASLKAGNTILAHLYYYDVDNDRTFYKYAEPVPIIDTQAADSITIREKTVNTASTSLTVDVTGYDDFKGGYLFLTTGKAGETDADDRQQIASARYTGAGTYTLNFNSASLKAGETIQPHLYYLSDDDKTHYAYGSELLIESAGGVTVEPKAEIVTSNITADRKDIWVSVQYDESLTGTLKIYSYAGNDYKEKEPIYAGAISSSENSQKVTFTGALTAGEKLVAELTLSDSTVVLSKPVTVQAVPEKTKPLVSILDKEITVGDTKMTSYMQFDSGVSNASYVLYQFTTDTLDTDTAEVISSGKLWRSGTTTLSMGMGKIKVGANLQIVLTADDEKAYSRIITVAPAPDWGTPYSAFDVSAVKADAKTIELTVDYSDEYLTLGDDFYCDVSIYQFSAAYTDDEFEDNELWENPNRVQRVAQANSTLGDATKGKLTIPVREGAVLNPGDRLIIKLRLPHTEWEGEEVDYVSASVPVIGADEEIPAYKVVLYNLGEDTSRGTRLRGILEKLGIPAETVTTESLNESVGYLAGLEGYDAAAEPYTGAGSDSEFMLICNLPESLLDRFLDEMTAEGLRIDHKAVVTAYNRDAELHELIDDIANEHDVFTTLIKLNDLVKQAEALSESTYGTSEYWQALQTEINASNVLLRSEEPSYEDLASAYDSLKSAYLNVTGMQEMQGTAVLTYTDNGDGTYNITANVKNGAENAVYQYKWNSGETAQTLTNVPKDKLITRIVTVSAENTLGTLTAQLAVPEKPELTVSAEAESVTVSWNAAEAADNRPLPESYTVTIAPANNTRAAAQTVTVSGDATSVKLEGLTSETAYTVTVSAESVVGRSDLASIEALTAKKEEPKDPEKPTDPEKPSQPEEPGKPSEPEKPSQPSEPTEPSEPTTPEEPDKPSEPEIPAKPEEPSTPTEPTKPDTPKTEPTATTPNNNGASSNAPKTGSTSDILGWSTLFLMSGSAVLSMIAYKKRTARK